ncbi:MAG: 4Fe-4S dicluster domain-containing protein [Candidatus Marinimicrobia bacterium]|nr:4Fe-4S dicluster domain-containing protein [Candidatus Neomarinimicrobiota bacterium]
MGHITGAKSNLVPLIDRLNKYPIGLVDNDKLREILAILFSETEAFVASKFPLREATLPELIELTDLPEEELLPVLESMANKGIIMDLPYGDKTYYLLMPGVIGFIEFTFMKNRTDIPMDKVARLMSEYFHWDEKDGQAKEFFGSKTQLTRSLPYEDHIPVNSEIVSYDSARDIIKNADFHAVAMCYCRHKREHEGKSCKKGAPVDGICMTIGRGAEFLVRRGFAERKTVAEMLDILQMAEDLHLTHITDNIRHKPSFICNCCGCCCEIMAGVQAGYYKGVNKTPYIAIVEQDICDYCGECFTACNIKAIGLDRENRNGNDRLSKVNADACLGCGACVSACEKGALSLILRSDYQLPPKTKRNMFMKIAYEKGRLAPLLTTRVKKKLGLKY